MTNKSLTQVILDKMRGDEDKPAPAARPSETNEKLLLEKAEGLKLMLRHGKHRITYHKVDGSEAVMECTLDPSFLPPADSGVADQSERKSKKPGLISVYATDRQGWRSFYADKVIAIEAV